MSFKVERDENHIPELIKILEELNRTEIHIGIFGKDDTHILMIANVNEFGCTIKPKGKRLAVPLNKNAREKSPRQFDDLFTLKTDDGSLYLVRSKGKNQLEFMYWLATEVTIPERAFIRGGFDENKDKFGKRAASLLKKVFKQEMSIDDFFTRMGEYIVGELQKYLNDLKEPPNSPITLHAKSPKTNPLVNEGRLRQAITYKVVKK